MDYRQWARDQDNSPGEPWPLPYKRELAKLKNQRLEEFRNTMDVNFGWLQDYYEGFRWAAIQRQYDTTDQSKMSHSGRVESSRRQHQHSDNADYPYDAPYVSGLKTPTLTYTDRGSYSKSPVSTHRHSHSVRQRPTADHFRLKTPKTPRGMMAWQSPRSPFERHRFTPRRTRIRVNASASARKLSRALKAVRKRTTGEETKSDGSSSTRNSHRSSASTEQTNAQVREVDISGHGTRRPTTVVQQNEPTRSSMKSANRQIEGDGREGDNIQHDRKSVGWGFLGEKDEPFKDSEEDEDMASYHTTPGSRARDSMQLFSPPMRLSADRESDYSKTPDLTRGRSASSRPSTFKRDNSFMDFDQELDIEEAEYKRPKSSPFLDSIAPVRFGSPERNGRTVSRPSKISSGSDRTVPSQSRTRDLSTGSEPGIRVTDSIPTKPDQKGERAETVARSNEQVGLPISRSMSASQDMDRSLFMDTANILERDSSGRHHRHVTEVVNENGERTGPHNEQQFSSGHVENSANDNIKSVPDVRNPPKDDRSLNHTSLLDLSKKTRLANTLPEKRTIFQRNRLAQGPSSQQTSAAAPPSSRLTKPRGILSQETTHSDLIHSTTTSLTSAGSKLSRTASQSILRDLKSAGTLGSAKGTPASSTTSTTTTINTSVSSVLRQGVPRAPLPSMRPTESSLARSGSQSSLVRKPFQTSKPALSLKRPIRQVLPDSTLTAKSISLISGSQVEASKSVRPPGSPKKEKRGMTPLETRLRELTPDVSAKPLLSSASRSSVQETSSASLLITGPLVSSQGNMTTTKTTTTANSLSSLSSSNFDQGKKASQRLQDSLQQLAQNSKFNLQSSSSVPTSTQIPERPFTNTSWTSSLPSDQRPSGRSRTILPDIPDDPDDGLDDTPSMNGSSTLLPKELGLPPWARWEELEKTLQEQASINPQEIFGSLPTLDISAMLPLGDRRPRPRLSSAKWGATDQLTTQEILKYNADMGWSTENA